jgi:hypothetical protein
VCIGTARGSAVVVDLVGLAGPGARHSALSASAAVSTSEPACSKVSWTRPAWFQPHLLSRHETPPRRADPTSGGGPRFGRLGLGPAGERRSCSDDAGCSREAIEMGVRLRPTLRETRPRVRTGFPQSPADRPRSPGWTTLPPSASTRSSTLAMSLTAKYGREKESPGRGHGRRPLELPTAFASTLPLRLGGPPARR